MSALTDARNEWNVLETGRLYFCPNAALIDRNYALHMQRGRLLDLAESIQTAGSVEAGVEAFRHTASLHPDPNEIAAAAALAGVE